MTPPPLPAELEAAFTRLLDALLDGAVAWGAREATEAPTDTARAGQ